MKNKILNDKNKGFTLLFAVLVSTLVLSVGASIISIALRQLVLSSTGRESQYAFYAANTGIECALYWDLISGTNFATPGFTTSGGTIIEPLIFSGSMNCVGDSLIGNKIIDNEPDSFYGYSAQGSTGETRFRIQFNEIGPNNDVVKYCADVIVTKDVITNGGRRRVATKILSRGYNTCDTNNPRRIERGLEMNY